MELHTLAMKMHPGVVHIIRSIDFEVFTISLRSDNIYVIEVKKEKEFTVEQMAQVIEAEEKLGGVKLPILILCYDLASTNVELMNYLARENANPYAKAEAYVLSSLNQRILAKFYTKIVKPARPTRFFSEEEEAMKWLKQFTVK